MDSSTQPIPQGYGTVTPWLISPNSAKLIEFLEQAFGAKETEGSRMINPDGSIGHVEVTVGNSVIMLFDSHKEWPETPGFFRLFLKDTDKAYEQAIAAGARPVTQVTELFWGDRVGRVCDLFGNIWWLQTHVKDVSYPEMQTRMQDAKMIKSMEYVQQSLTDELDHRK